MVLYLEEGLLAFVVNINENGVTELPSLSIIPAVILIVYVVEAARSAVGFNISFKGLMESFTREPATEGVMANVVAFTVAMLISVLNVTSMSTFLSTLVYAVPIGGSVTTVAG